MKCVILSWSAPAISICFHLIPACENNNTYIYICMEDTAFARSDTTVTACFISQFYATSVRERRLFRYFFRPMSCRGERTCSRRLLKLFFCISLLFACYMAIESRGFFTCTCANRIYSSWRESTTLTYVAVLFCVYILLS